MNLNNKIDIQKLCDYLKLHVSSSRHMNCISPSHNDSTASMNVYKEANTLGCLGCGRHYSPIQVYQEIKSVSEERAVKDLTKLLPKLNFDSNENDLKKETKSTYEDKLALINFKQNDKVQKYFDRRNIPNSARYLKKCGYKIGLNDTNNICYVFDELIIEVTDGYPKYLNHGISEPITLSYYKNKPYMIVEGIADGLSALHMKYNAIVLNGVTNVSKLKVQLDLEYIIALDRDIAGVKKFDILESKLEGTKYRYFDKLYLSRVKDLNDLLKIKEPIFETVKLKSEYLTMDIIDKAMQYEKSLLIAPTGIGKTTAIFSYCLICDEPNTKYVICCPNKIQNSQNENNFEGIQAVIKGVKPNFDVNVYSVVYDRAHELVSSLKDKGYRVILVVDEAHNLVYSKGFRKSAIKKLLKAELEADKSLRITATADTIKNDMYNYIISIPNRGLKVKHTKILNLKGDRKANLIDILGQEVKNFDKTIVYTDLIELQNIVRDKFNFDVLNSKTDVTDKIYQDITKNESISNNLITTSVMQAGSNIKLPGEKVLFIFHCNSVKDLNYEKLIQAISRVRTGIDTLIITIGEEKEDLTKSYAQHRALISANIDKKLKETKKYMYKLYDENSNVMDIKLDEYIENETFMFNNYYDKYDKKHSLNALEFLQVDYLEIEKMTMESYNKQFYYNGKALLNILNLSGEVAEHTLLVSLPTGESKMLKGKENFEVYKEILSNTPTKQLELVLDNPMLSSDYELFDKAYSNYNTELFIIKKYISEVKKIKNLILGCNTVTDLKDIKFILQYNNLEKLYSSSNDKLNLLPFGMEYKLIRDTLPLKGRLSDKKKKQLSSSLNIDKYKLNTFIKRIYKVSNNKITGLITIK